MNSELIEANAARALFEHARGGVAGEAGGAICTAVPALASVTMINRATPVEDDVDLHAVEAFFEPLGVRYAVAVTPQRDALARELEARGYERGYAWAKFTQPAREPAPAETDLRVEELGRDDGDALDLVVREAYGMPDVVAGFLASAVGAPNLHCFVAWAGDEPAAAGAVYVEGGFAWFGVAGTRERFRRRGGQNAIVAARLRRARELGAHTLVTETGELVPERPSSSYRNILRAGFRQEYVRANWLSPQ